MVEELRNHDANPTEEERDWMDYDPFAFLIRLAAVAVLGVMIGVYVGLLVDPHPRGATVVESTPATSSR